jgi:hypothetical protein
MALAMDSSDDDDDDSFTAFLFAHCENRSSSSSLLRRPGGVEELSNLVSVGIVSQSSVVSEESRGVCAREHG